MKLPVSLITALLATPALATVNIQFEFGALRGAGSPGSPVVSSTLVLLIADSDGSGTLPTSSDLLNATLSNNQVIAGDTVFYAGYTGNDPVSGAFTGTALGVDYAALGVNQNDIWGIYWFPGVSAEGTTATGGQAYGAYQTSVLDAATVSAVGATDPMLFPADSGSTVRTAYYDDQTLASFSVDPTANSPSATDFSANLVVVPEPSALVLGALGGLALLRRRRS